VDVAVVGGGSAGVAAALAAARAGARTALIEASDRLGGNASLAQVHTICGLYHPADEGPARSLHAGLPLELVEALQRDGAAGGCERAGRVHYLPIDPEGYARWLERVCAAEADLTVHRGAGLEAARLRDDGVELRCATGEVCAAFVVDASGAAVVAARLGADRIEDPAEQLQAPSFIVELEGVATQQLEGYARLQISASLAKASRDEVLPAGAESVVVRRSVCPDRAFLTLGVATSRPGGGVYDPRVAPDRVRLEEQARAVTEAVVDHLRASRPIFADARVRAWPQRLGIRESGRGRTRLELDAAHVLGGVRPDDEVALSSWPIELWRDHRRAHFEHPEAACGIPLDALISRSHERLLFAGRCMGGTHESLGALRVIGTAWATGQAAGVAAARAALHAGALGEVSPAEVRKVIEGLGRVRTAEALR